MVARLPWEQDGVGSNPTFPTNFCKRNNMKFNLYDLKKYRQRFFLTQYDICGFLGVSDVAYRTWELRVRKPKDKNFDRLIEIFNILDKNAEKCETREASLAILEESLGYGEEI